MTRWRPSELERLSGTRGEELLFAGGGTVEDVHVDDLRYRDVEFDAGMFDRRRTTFVRCEFSRWRVTRAQLRGVSLRDCTLRSATFAAVQGVRDMVGCRVEGVFRVWLSGRHSVVGNDFSRAVGVHFEDGVDLSKNTFATDGSQLVLDRRQPGWEAVRRRAQAGAVVARSVVAGLSGAQVAQLLTRADMLEEDWAFYSSVVGVSVETSPVEVRAASLWPEAAVAKVISVSDPAAGVDSADAVFHGDFDIQAGLAGIEGLAVVLSVPDDAYVVVADDPERAVVRLEPAVRAALVELSDAELPPAAQAWAEVNEELAGGQWAEDPLGMLGALKIASAVQGELYVDIRF